MKKTIFLIMTFCSFGFASPQIPSLVFDKILFKDSPDINLRINRFFYAPLSLKIEFVDFKQAPIEIRLPEGGGDVYLLEHLPKKNEPYFFKLKFNFFIEEQDLKTVRAYFVNYTNPQDFSGLRFGASCNTIIDLSSTFRAGGMAVTNGIEMTTNHNRFFYTIGGDFIFAWESRNETYLTRVHFMTDTNWVKPCL